MGRSDVDNVEYRYYGRHMDQIRGVERREMKCPVCGQREKMKVQLTYGGPVTEMDAPLYQVSYPGQPEYLPPRCLKCYKKVVARRDKKRA